jgi:hypothetical protein
MSKPLPAEGLLSWWGVNSGQRPDAYSAKQPASPIIIPHLSVA